MLGPVHLVDEVQAAVGAITLNVTVSRTASLSSPSRAGELEQHRAHVDLARQADQLGAEQHAIGRGTRTITPSASIVWMSRSAVARGRPAARASAETLAPSRCVGRRPEQRHRLLHRLVELGPGGAIAMGPNPNHGAVCHHR